MFRLTTLILAVFLTLFPRLSHAEVHVGTDVGVDVGIVGQPGVSLEERAAGISYLHLLGLSLSTGRAQFVAQTGIPIPPSFSVQAVFESTFYPRGVRRSGVALGARLRALPIWWIADRSRCAARPEPCHGVDGSWGGLIEPSVGWQFAVRKLHLGLRPTLAYSAGFASSHNAGLPTFHHGGVFTLHLQTWPRR